MELLPDNELSRTAKGFLAVFKDVADDADLWTRRDAVSDAWERVIMTREFEDETLPARILPVLAQYIDGNIPIDRLRRVFTAWSMPCE